MQSILIVDDEISIRESLTGILQDEGFTPISVDSGEKALEKIIEDRPDLILLDIWMPGMDGLETLTKIRNSFPDQLVVMMSGHGSIETAVKSTKLGAYDFIEKPLSLEKVLLCIQNAIKTSQLVEENRELKAKIGKEHEMIGSSKPIREMKKQIKIAAPTSGWILITGENGTGKELVARSIHHNSHRQDQAFVEVNCAAIPETLMESEFFGHAKGAFTGAVDRARGKFLAANDGTLFLEEIGEISLKTQAKVLRILQERKFERVGGNKTIEVDVRVIAATNKDLEKEIAAGNFREDLYYRLNVIPFHVPPLRERGADIPHLATHFLEYFCSKESRETKRLDDEAMQAIQSYSWPGNVRELKNLIERLVIMSPGNTITRAQLPQSICGKPHSASTEQSSITLSADTFRCAKEKFEKEFLTQKLEENEWNISRTAESIEIERSNLHRKIKSYGIELKKG